MTVADYVIYSDGGSRNHQNAASACLLLSKKTGRQLCLGAYFGVGTNNEAEILALLLGLLVLRAKVGTNKEYSVLWVSDSEYSLKSASQYIKNWQRNGWKTADKSEVKNQGLWKLFLELSAKVELQTKHVRGHSGHRENEICDEIVGELKSFAETAEAVDFMSGKKKISTRGGLLEVRCFNAESWMERLRRDNPTKADFEYIAEQVQCALEEKTVEKTREKQKASSSNGDSDTLAKRISALRITLQQSLKELDLLEDELSRVR